MIVYTVQYAVSWYSSTSTNIVRETSSKILDGTFSEKKKSLEKKKKKKKKSIAKTKMQLYQAGFIRVVADGIGMDGTTAEK